MEKELQQIAGLPDVGGAFLCDNAGEVLASSNPPVLASATMATLGREAARAFEALEAAGLPSSRLELRYDSWQLIARDLEQCVLLVVCHPGVDGALVRMTADIGVAMWKKDGKHQKRLAKSRASRSALLAQATMDEVSFRSWRRLEIGA